MNGRIPTVIVFLVAGSFPAPATGQDPAPDRVVRAPEVRAIEPSGEASEGRMSARADSLVRRALLAGDEQRERAANEAHAWSHYFVSARPEAADAWRWRAVTGGLLAELSGPGDKVRLGRMAYDSALRALELAPEHAGAHHVLGRLYAGVAELGWMTRFFAARMGMGELVDAASWEDAEHHLRRAVDLDATDPVYRFDLALLLVGRERVEEALPYLRGVVAGRPDDAHERRQRDRARDLLIELGEPAAGASGIGGEG